MLATADMPPEAHCALLQALMPVPVPPHHVADFLARLNIPRPAAAAGAANAVGASLMDAAERSLPGAGGAAIRRLAMTPGQAAQLPMLRTRQVPPTALPVVVPPPRPPR
ncbi:hypothetical protein Vretifemale_20492 [Volvox reticuliferus]|uniref:Uncharacterized protein n=1 Tax=Volvox reticuliferus TaxID=1737510 RepID=A0A8J4FXC2_9CHLO|nr:hypothetical protein Vretifemale_20492 [Volvox reticuliferus]